MKKFIRSTELTYPTRESIMKEARDAAKRFTTERMSYALKTNLNDLGYYQEDKRKSGFQYLDEILKNCFTEGLPGPMYSGEPQIEALDVDEFHSWNNNCDIIRAVKDSIRFCENY